MKIKRSQVIAVGVAVLLITLYQIIAQDSSLMGCNRYEGDGVCIEKEINWIRPSVIEVKFPEILVGRGVKEQLLIQKSPFHSANAILVVENSANLKNLCGLILDVKAIDKQGKIVAQWANLDGCMLTSNTNQFDENTFVANNINIDPFVISASSSYPIVLESKISIDSASHTVTPSSIRFSVSYKWGYWGH